MQTKQKPQATKPAQATPAQATPAQATPANPLQAMAATLTAPQAATVQVPAVQVAVPATFAGVPFAQLAKHQQAVATAKAPQQVGAAIAGTLYVANPAKPYRVQAANNAQWYAACTAALAKGPQTAATLAQACGYPGFVGYLVRKGWLVPAASVPSTPPQA